MTTDYTNQLFNRYSRLHAGITTHYQRETYLAVVPYMSGDIVEFGCGTGKAIPFLADSPLIDSYLGLDASEDMIHWADLHIQETATDAYLTECCRIEQFKGKRFDNALCINVYYTWAAPAVLLKYCHRLIKPGGYFVLATPNNQFDTKKLIHELDKTLLAHPYYDDFKAMNLSLSSSKNARFPVMNQLVNEVQEAGFELVSCHSQFFDCGLSFLVCKA